MSTLGIQPRLDYELRIPKGREQFVPANRLNDEDIKYGVEGQTEFLAGYKPGVKYHEIQEYANWGYDYQEEAERKAKAVV